MCSSAIGHSFVRHYTNSANFSHRLRMPQNGGHAAMAYMWSECGGEGANAWNSNATNLISRLCPCIES